MKDRGRDKSSLTCLYLFEGGRRANLISISIVVIGDYYPTSAPGIRPKSEQTLFRAKFSSALSHLADGILLFGDKLCF